MKITNQQVKNLNNKQERRSPIVLWSFLGVLIVFSVFGILSFMAYKVDQAKNSVQPPVMESSETATQTDATDIQRQIDRAVEEALSEQEVLYQKEIAQLKEQVSTVDDMDIEGYQVQIEDLTAERDALVEANEELTASNQALSDTNAELSERTTVSDIQTAYEEQITQLKADNAELEDILKQVQERLEQEADHGDTVEQDAEDGQ